MNGRLPINIAATNSEYAVITKTKFSLKINNNSTKTGKDKIPYMTSFKIDNNRCIIMRVIRLKIPSLAMMSILPGPIYMP